MTTWGEHLERYQIGKVSLFSVDFIKRWGDQAWSPHADDQKAAGALHTQITSRITTQPLGYLDGDEATALDSVYKLFGHTRDITDRFPACTLFEAVAWHVLNTHVRPFTAKWHLRKIQGALRALDSTDEFRAELSQLQPILSRFDELLITIRDGAPPPRAKAGGENAREQKILDEMRQALNWGVLVQDNDAAAQTLRELNSAEGGAIWARRKYYGIPQNKPHAIALALSGGGIRSATFSLGVLVALAKRNILPQFDYLSTVSGGGYIGAFLTSFLSVPNPGDRIGLHSSQLPFKRERGEAEALRDVRHRSRFLQSSPWERPTIASAQLYGMILNTLAIILLIACIAALELFIRSTFYFGNWPRTPVYLGAFATLIVVVHILGRFRWLTPTDVDGWLGFTTLVLLVLLSWYLLGFLHGAWQPFTGKSSIWSTVGFVAAGVLPLLAAGGITLVGRRFRIVQLVLLAVAALAVPVFFLLVELALYDFAQHWIQGSESRIWRWVAVIAFLLAVAAFVFFTLDVNVTSPHRHYRAKLAKAFLGQSSFDAQSNRLVMRLRVSEATGGGRGPYHLVNCALNVPSSSKPAIQGRLTDFFLFSPAFSGSLLTGYHRTEQWETADRNLDFATAFAISGAAASPQMGLSTLRHLSFWLTLLNIRLGYWVLKPLAGHSAPPRLGYLLKEMLGKMDERGPYLNVSDGGHIENLGVYELLRRRCKYIVAVDGEQDANMTFHALTTLQRLAAIDLGITIDMNLDDLRLNYQGLSRSHFRFCRIRYPGRHPGAEEYGYLLYLKLSLTGNEGEFIRRYRYDEPAFPHHSTADQFFTETQFEAYRSLGEHIGDKLFLTQSSARTSPKA
jgi:hypothetical protein